jgi:hypothetical protein
MSLGSSERTGARSGVARHAAAPALRAPKLPPPTTPPVVGLAAPTVSTADAATLRPTPAPLTLTHETVVVGDEAQALLQLFNAAISHLDAVSATEHSEKEENLLRYFAEPGITKVVAWDGAEPVGLGILTNDLSLIDLPSSIFFANKYPEHAARGAIFYGMTVLVKESERGLTAFSRIYLDMWQIPALVNGVLAFDICQFNVESYDAEKIIAGIAANFPNSRWGEVDRQIWYVAELPEPLR